MNNKALTLSIFMAVFAVFLVQSYVSSIEDEAKKKFGTEILVVTAKQDIKEMETVTEASLELKNIPKRFLEPAAISFENKSMGDEQVTGEMKKLVGSVAVVPIKKGEQVTYNKLTEPSMRTGLSPQVSPGKRAISVPVNDISGISKLVKPGDRVDLIAVIDPGTGRENKMAKTVLQDVIVLAVGRNVANNVARVLETDTLGRERVRSLTQDSTFGTVTLEVEPNQVQMISLLVTGGDNLIQLALRHNDDTERVLMPATTLQDVLGPDISRLRMPAGRK